MNDIGVGYQEKTIFGGCLALFAWFLLVSEFVITMDRIYWKRDNDYTSNKIFLTAEETEETSINLDDKNHFIFGIHAGEIEHTNLDQLNNPYIEWSIGTFEWSINRNVHFELEHCSEEETGKIIGPLLRPLYS